MLVLRELVLRAAIVSLKTMISGSTGEDIDQKEEHFYSGGAAIDLRWAQLSIGASNLWHHH